MTRVDVSNLSTRPDLFEAHATLARHVRVVLRANSDYQIGVDGNLEISKMRALVHHAPHELKSLAFPPLTVGQ